MKISHSPHKGEPPIWLAPNNNNAPNSTKYRYLIQHFLGGGGGSAGGGPWGGGCSQGGGGYTRPTATTCIPAGGMCVWGGFGEAAGGCCEAVSCLKACCACFDLWPAHCAMHIF